MNEQIKSTLDALEIKKVNPMQEAAFENIVAQKEVMLLSPTGSGKTLAFLLPLIQLLKTDEKQVQALILVPSRELALQIEQVWKKMSTGFKVNTCYGGHSMQTEIQNLSSPPALLIGTPGRIADHIERNTFSLDNIETLILDEFDKSLELGFHEQMLFIINHLRRLKKKILVSATAGIEVPEFVDLKSPKILDFLSKDSSVNQQLHLCEVISPEKDKLNTLFDLLCMLNSEAALVFCNHRDATERTSQYLNSMGLKASFYHGGMEQDDRELALVKFRNGSVKYLITTDLGARGLDIPEMKHVIHYHLPLQEHEFIHRNGRTARMHATGTAYVVLAEEENRPHYLAKDIEQINLLGKKTLPQLPDYETLYISGGKKNKINKIDIVGFLSQKGQLEKEDLGLIEVKDFTSFVAVKREKVKVLLQLIRNEKMKGKKYKIEIAR
ncbi:DEAD/DEAH box helicase domain protein [Emticicia oligotrophica DSM 17448]|uniref:DEAD/DEAH box helicase domain protein n=1 Tax=Emticicia oligotrophica (strain DSM 17448 / CIP 109782 / MTCC 6937 / GPTSA100-15) TaxID=929562 RepID=A0ABN4AM25_EMTOG|nr:MULTISPECIES: DEAD/DEAH box helicase [Emticicia]AFK03242.1 DEAD/DEAH box helicase domain protein [Emticicia oligotrophica DSM 17448]